MAEIKLTIAGITNTVDSNNTPVDSAETTMSIGGSTIVNGTCSFSVKYNKSRVKPLPKGATETSTLGDQEGALSFDLAIQRFSFVKQMYSPNEITVQVQIAPSADPSGDYRYTAKIKNDILKDSFCNKQVKLTIDDESVGDDFYIHDLVPVYKSDAIYATMHIFSPDKQMTLATGNRTFVSEKLKKILSTLVPTFNIPYNQSPISYKATNMKTLLSGEDEHIFPYLVQYNESFYDFLARTTNRWGEFLYYEDGNLNIGYEDTKTEVTDYDSYTFLDINDSAESVDKYNSEATYDPHVLNNVLKKGGYDEIKGLIFCSKGWDLYLLKKVSQFLRYDTNIVDWIFGTLVDDGVALAVAKKISKDKNDTFDDKYFSDSKIKELPEHFGNSDEEFNEFSEYTPIADDVKYLTVLKGEVAAARNAIQIDLDTSWQNLKLGETIKFKTDGCDETEYIIVKIEGSQADQYKIEDDRYLIRLTDVSSSPVTFRITAIAKDSTDSRFYPTVIPAGHVRKSDPQVAEVMSNDDPLRINRVRVKYAWDENSEKSPWLVFATNIGYNGVGMQGRHHTGDKVLVDYHYGNIERPYVTGAIPKSVPFALRTNEVVCNTPGGQAIKLSDGAGAGATAMMAGMLPCTKLLQGFFPAYDMFTSKDDEGNPSDADSKAFQSRNFEGSIEMGDKYGIWNIKGSTDGRNVTINSSWGTVNINAFTGITISAPNGDVNIKGKNVNIVAGNNLTLMSGKNVKDKWYPALTEYKDLESTFINLSTALSVAVFKKVTEMAVSMIDISILRNLWELFVKPVEGKLEIKSNRYMMLEAGGAEAKYPVDAYNKNKRVKVNEDYQAITDEFSKINALVNDLFDNFKNKYRTCQGAKRYLELVIDRTTKKTGNNQEDVPPCKSAADIIAAIWNGTNIDDGFLEYKGMAKKVEDADNKDEIIKFFYPTFVPDYVGPRTRKIFVEGTKKKQKLFKEALFENIKVLQDNINTLKSCVYFNYCKENKITISKLFNALSQNLLDNSCLKKLLKDEDFKKLTMVADTLFTDEDKKKLRRKFYVTAVDTFEIQQFKTVDKITGMPVDSNVTAPDPYGADQANVETKWAEYVKSLWRMPEEKKEEADLGEKFLMASIAKPAMKAGINSWIDFGKNTADHFAFGPEKKGAILFTSKPGTMVLGQEIYRANTDFAEDVTYGENDTTSGLVARIREIMNH